MYHDENKKNADYILTFAFIFATKTFFFNDILKWKLKISTPNRL